MFHYSEQGSARSRRMTTLLSVLLALAIVSTPAKTRAFTSLEIDSVVVQTSLYTTHFDPEPHHNNHQRLISVELHNPDRWLAGGAHFRNSYNQPTWYAFIGRQFSLWQPHEHVELHGKITGGLLHGYDGEHRDAIPFNRYGTAPVILPSLGVRVGRLESDVVFFGVAGLMVTGGLRF